MKTCLISEHIEKEETPLGMVSRLMIVPILITCSGPTGSADSRMNGVRSLKDQMSDYHV